MFDARHWQAMTIFIFHHIPYFPQLFPVICWVIKLLVGGFNPAEKISQLGWLFPKYGKINLSSKPPTRWYFLVVLKNTHPNFRPNVGPTAWPPAMPGTPPGGRPGPSWHGPGRSRPVRNTWGNRWEMPGKSVEHVWNKWGNHRQVSDSMDWSWRKPTGN